MHEFPEQQLDAMKAEHRRLDAEIEELRCSGVIDQLQLARLKKRKLQLKDYIQLMIDRNTPDIIA